MTKYNKFSIVEFSCSTSSMNNASSTTIPKKRGRPAKHSLITSPQMIVKSTEVMEKLHSVKLQPYEVEFKQFAPQKRVKMKEVKIQKKQQQSTLSRKCKLIETESNECESCHSSKDSITPLCNISTMNNIEPVMISSQPVQPILLSTSYEASPTRRIIRTSISIKELLN